MKAMYAILAATGVLVCGAGEPGAGGGPHAQPLSVVHAGGGADGVERDRPAGERTTPVLPEPRCASAGAATTCPADQAAAAELVAGPRSGPGGQRARGPRRGGDLRHAIGVRPTGGGPGAPLRLSHDGGPGALAGAGLTLDIRPRAPTGRRATIPEEPRRVQGLPGAALPPEGCIRRVIRQANGRCRRLPTDGAGLTCLREVPPCGRPADDEGGRRSMRASLPSSCSAHVHRSDPH